MERAGKRKNEVPYGEIYTDEKEFYLYAKVSDLSPYFDSDERFYPCMKGMVVNFDRVSSMKDQIIYFRNGMQYMLGRTNYLKTKQTFVNYMTAKKFD